MKFLNGAPALLTAGHCRRDENNNAVLQRTPDGDQVVGSYVRWETVGSHDISLVDLVGSSIPVVPELDGMAVTSVMNAVELRNEQPELCKSGARTGLSCGPITAITETKVSFRAWDDMGDSGAPVYARKNDGTVSAVGILFGHSDDSEGRTIHASLVAPVMAAWKLGL